MKISWADDHEEQCPYGRVSGDGVTISDCARVVGHEGPHLLGHLEHERDLNIIASEIKAFDARKWVLHEEFRRVMIALGEWPS